jgi:hypothetical protein
MYNNEKRQIWLKTKASVRRKLAHGIGIVALSLLIIITVLSPFEDYKLDNNDDSIPPQHIRIKRQVVHTYHCIIATLFSDK